MCIICTHIFIFTEECKHCDKNARCVNGHCVCRNNYVGDGLECWSKFIQVRQHITNEWGCGRYDIFLRNWFLKPPKQKSWQISPGGEILTLTLASAAVEIPLCREEISSAADLRYGHDNITQRFKF